MAIETVTTEGDFVVKSLGRDILRVHMGEDSMTVVTHCGGQNRNNVICDISEARQLRDWLTRRLEEEV
jgi:hypothetical protein